MRVLIILILLFPVPSLATDNYPKNPDLDIRHYSFSIQLSDEKDKIEGQATIYFTFKKDRLEKLRLDLINKTESLLGKGMIVNRVQVNNQDVNFTHEQDELWIKLPIPSTANVELVASISYHGVPATGLKIGNNKYGDRCFFSDNWPNKARHWLPLIDHPYDKATCEFIVESPNHYQVISNGIKVEESILTNGNKLTHWKQSVPIATWLYALGVAEFAIQYVGEFEGKSIQTWVYKQDREAGFYDFAVPTMDALRFYSDYVGPFAYEKLANVQTNSVKGGMEAATAIFYDDNSVTGKRTERWQHVIIHEVAHQWFGNSVTEYDWDDVWLSEGFATYFTLLYIEHAFGREKFVEELIKSRDKIYEFYAKNKDYRIVHDNLSNMDQVTTIQTYQKGAWILHMLRNEIGDENFKKGIQSYYKKYYNQNASTSDFIREVELASGKDLDMFFKQWLYQGGNIELDIKWNYDSKKSKLVLNINQRQNQYEFTFPVEVAIYLPDSQPMLHTSTVDKNSIRIEIPCSKRPERIVIDPNTKLLATWTIKNK